jgi:hypothetical protein
MSDVVCNAFNTGAIANTLELKAAISATWISHPVLSKEP